jgi:hypothetical protein
MTDRPQRIGGALLLYHRPALFPDAATITDHINAFERYSRFPFWKLNTDRGFPKGLTELEFDAIVVHYTVFASGPSPFMLDDDFLEYADSAASYKVAFFQDEHQYCQKRFGFLNEHRFDCVYTCIEPEHFDATYRRYTEVPTLVSHVPAYVAPEMVATAERLHRPDAEREIDIGYRARPTPPFFGRGGMDKVEIANRFLGRAGDADLRLDISTREQDRLYGENWYRLIANCRGFLGTESGASCVDLEDEVREEYERLVAAGEEATIERLERGALGRWDWKVPLRTTSSRHFEAAALRSCLLMYEGRYSGVLRPMEHYIPLQKDLSNFDAAIELFSDPEVRRELTENAYRDLIASGQHSYERFIAGFDRTLIAAGLDPPPADAAPAEVKPALTGHSRWRAVRRYLGGASFWLLRRHPLVWKLTIRPALSVIWLLNAVVARPIRKLLGRPAPTD